jgi:hypothetical protein
MAQIELQFSGIHAEICGRLDDDWLRCDRSKLQVALDFRDQYQRGRHAVEVIRDIWRSFEGRLGATPAVDLLFEHEEYYARKAQGQRTYSGHRDHIVHTLELYLLGLDLLKGLPTLRKTLADHVGDETALKSAWAIAALGHDPGYVFEVPEMAKTPERIQDLLRDPLSDFDQIISRAELRKIPSRFHVDTDSPDSLEDYDGRDFFEWLELEAHTGLGPLRKYHEFARRHGRHQYDHGVMSAMLLFQAYFRLRRRVEFDIMPYLETLRLRSDQSEFIARLNTELPNS